MNKSGPIVTERYQAEINRLDVVLAEVWIRRPQAAETTFGEWFGASLPSIQGSGPKVMLLMLGGSLPSGISDLLRDHLRADGRAYLLVAATFDPEKALGHLTDAEKAQVLIRTHAAPPMSGYHRGHAGVWYRPLADESVLLMLRLDEAQAEEWKHLFLQAFWHESEAEIFLSKGKWTRPETCWSRPMDIPNRELARWRKVPDKDSVTPTGFRCQISHLRGRRSNAVEKLHTSPNFGDPAKLAEIAGRGTAIHGLSPALPECHLETQGNWAVIGDPATYSLLLSFEQAQEARDHLKAAESVFYARGLTLGAVKSDMPDSTLLTAGLAKPEPLIAAWPIEGPKNLGKVEAASLRDTLADHLRWAKDDAQLRPHPLALTARYTWEVAPPTCPSNSPDKIYEDWRRHTEACKTFQARIGDEWSKLKSSDAGSALADPLAQPEQKSLSILLEQLEKSTSANLNFSETRGERQKMVDRLLLTATELKKAAGHASNLLVLAEWQKALNTIDTEIQAAERKLEAKKVEDAQDKKNDGNSEAKKMSENLAKLNARRKQLEEPPTLDGKMHQNLQSVASLDGLQLSRLPDFHPPAVGKLYSVKNPNGSASRYLAISNWQDYVKAEDYAAEFKAALVAERK